MLRFGYPSIAATLLFLAYVAFNASALLGRPHYNWDMLPYIAVALQVNGVSDEEIHARAYQTVRAQAPEQAYLNILRQNPYRQAVAENAHYFREQLPFFAVKVGYTHLLAALNRLGVPLVKATILISLAAYVATCCLVFAWLLRRFNVPLALLLALGFSSSYELLATSRLSTPDMLSGFVVLLGIYLYLEHDRARTAIAVLAASLALRPDNAVLVFPFLAYVFLLRRDLRVAAAAGAACAAAIYAGEIAISGNRGWPVLFHHTLVERVYDPSAFRSSLTVTDYARHIFWNMLPSRINGDLYLRMTLGVLAVALRVSWAGRRDPYVHVLLIGLAYMLINTMILPLDVDRRQIGIVLFLLISLACTAGEIMKARPLVRDARSRAGAPSAE